MSSNNRPWKEVNFIRRYEEKNSNRLKESRGLNILSIELEDKVVCPDRYYDDEACETFSSYEDFEEICKDYRDSVEPNDYEYDDMELILPKAVISYLEDGVKKSDRVSLGISVIVNSAIGVEIDDYLEVFFNNSFNGETIRVGSDGIESLLNTGVLKLNNLIIEKKGEYTSYNLKKECFSRKFKENIPLATEHKNTSQDYGSYWKLDNIWDEDLYNEILESYEEDIYDYFNRHLDDYVKRCAKNAANSFWLDYLNNNRGNIAASIDSLCGVFDYKKNYKNQEITADEIKEKIEDILKNRKSRNDKASDNFYQKIRAVGIPKKDIK